MVLVLTYWGLKDARLVALPVIALPTRLNHPEVARFFIICFQGARRFVIFLVESLWALRVLFCFIWTWAVSSLSLQFGSLENLQRICFCLLKCLTLTYESIRHTKHLVFWEITTIAQFEHSDNNKVEFWSDELVTDDASQFQLGLCWILFLLLRSPTSAEFVVMIWQIFSFFISSTYNEICCHGKVVWTENEGKSYLSSFKMF